MLIDPFTVAAQVVNFLILIWVLRRVLYGPVTRAMAAREARIREELDEARRRRAEAEAEGERYRQLVAGFEEERTARLAEARAELDAWRHSHMQTVRAEIDAMRERWQQALRQEKDAFLLDLRARAGREVLAAARRVLRALADADLEARMVTRFLAEVRGLPAERRDQLAAAARDDGGRLHVRSAFALDAADRERLERALAEALGDGLALELDTAPDLIAGVELRAGGLKVAWALDDYLGAIEDTFREALEDGPEAGHGRR